MLVGKLRKNKKAVARWLRTKALIIDESRSPSRFQEERKADQQYLWWTERCLTSLINSVK